MAVNLSPVGGVAAQFFDNSGNPLTGMVDGGAIFMQSPYTSPVDVWARVPLEHKQTIRKKNLPPWCRAKSQLNNAVRAPPT